jgi:hypothetical protein
MKQQRLVGVLSLAGGILFLILAVRFFQRGDLTMSLLTGVAGSGLLGLACQDFIRLRKS